jgi:hypothetical protein
MTAKNPNAYVKGTVQEGRIPKGLNRRQREEYVFGRPSKYDKKKIAEELIEWAKKPTSINLNGFCCEHDPILAPQLLLIWTREDPDFLSAYCEAKAFIGKRREELHNQDVIKPKTYAIHAPVYDIFLQDDSDETFILQSEIKANTDNIVPQSPNQEVLDNDTIKFRQAAKIARLEAELESLKKKVVISEESETDDAR